MLIGSTVKKYLRLYQLCPWGALHYYPRILPNCGLARCCMHPVGWYGHQLQVHSSWQELIISEQQLQCAEGDVDGENRIKDRCGKLSLERNSWFVHRKAFVHSLEKINESCLLDYESSCPSLFHFGLKPEKR